MTRVERLQLKRLDESEYKKIYQNNQKYYLKKRLLAIKYLYEGKTRLKVIKELKCAHQSLANWIDLYLEGGLTGLVKEMKIPNRKQSLSKEQKAELMEMMFQEKPKDYGIDRNLWTGKILEEVIEKKWGVILKDSRIYTILAELGLSHQKAHRDYENSDPEAQKAFVTELKKKVEDLKPDCKLVCFDEFSIWDRPSLYYAWAKKNTRPEVPSDEKRKRNRVNGMMSVDAVTGEIYLQMKDKAKAEDIARYIADLCEDAYKGNTKELTIVLDNVPTHKNKMKKLVSEHLETAGIRDKIKVDFMHTPPYSPELNLTEYEIHLLRLKELHHMPSNITMDQIKAKLNSIEILMNPEQISHTLNYIYNLGNGANF
jgi:transposase